MNKPQSLRHALNKAVPYVRNNPDKLHLFVDNGSLVATGASSMSWEYRYTLNVVIEDFSGDQNLLMAPVLLWLRDNQPDAINNPALREKLFTFDVDILRNDVCDISLKARCSVLPVFTITACVIASVAKDRRSVTQSAACWV